MDVMPTLLDACGIDIPDTVDGRSVLPLLRGETGWRETIHGEHCYETGSAHFIVTSRDKFIWYSHTGKEQYFDLVSDPQELNNRIDDESCQERIKHLRRALIDDLKGREEGHTDGEKLIPGRPCSPILKAVFPDA